MKQLRYYLQSLYLKILIQTVGVVGLCMVFIISIRVFKAGSSFNIEHTMLFAVSSFFEAMPWSLCFAFYVYLMKIATTGEYTLLKTYSHACFTWISLWPIWSLFSLLTFLYVGFLAPALRQQFLNQNPLDPSVLNRPQALYDGTVWLDRSSGNLGLNWWHQLDDHLAKLKVEQVNLSSTHLILGDGRFDVLYPKRTLKLNFKKGRLQVGQSPLGVKYKSIVACVFQNKWSEIGFRSSSMGLICFGSLLILLLFEACNKWALPVFLGIMLFAYLPLWSFVKSNRETLSFGLTLAPSWLLLIIILALGYRLRRRLG